MDKITNYKNIVRSLVEEVVALSEPTENGVENQLITDDEHGHYLYFGVGWDEQGDNWFYASFIHIDIKENGKVWIQHDGTDLRIAQKLTENGILKSDIVIGFQKPAVRKFMDGYATA